MPQPDFPALIVTMVRRLCILFFSLLASTLPCSAFASGHAEHLLVQQPDDFQGDLLIFPDLTGVSRIDQGPLETLHDNQFIPELNLFYTADYKRFRFLGEWLVSNLTHNLERFQLGLHLGESSLWLGRFHNPIGYWNMQFHHAAFLQSTTSRPGIMAFETQGGVIPNHLTGFLWEGVHEFEQAGVYYTIGAGAGPQLSYMLSPLNLIEPGGAHRPAATFRLGYQPISYGINEIGISGAYTEIPAQGLAITDVKQYVATTYANWQFEKVRFLSEIVYANNHIDSYLIPQTTSDFANAYAQLDWDFTSDWTLIGRIEGTYSKHNDPYLDLFPKYVQDRFLGGILYKVNHNNSLKFEVSRDYLRDDHFEQMMAQWSAIFP
jgi:hypothetical protein